MNKPRIMIAATNSGCGKTTITCGLLSALKKRGMKPCSFKCGPDYIDPMYHRNVLGIESGNLDTFFTEDDVTRWIFKEECSGDIAVIEGVMGLYDGVGGVEKKGSSYDLARALDCPIILVVNAKGAGRSVVATIKGFLDYDNHNLIKGVILNKTSKSFGQILKPIIEEELGIKCLGTLSDISDINISSRHLGLILPEEIADIKNQLAILEKRLSDEIDVASIIEIANSAKAMEQIAVPNSLAILNKPSESVNTIKLAVAKDEAFCFYYRENLSLLEHLGVNLEFFSPIHD
ncbi:MAG: cobyrinate a,c-diamide synthase, partial [Pseudobutyrivibrio sp.]|nr:cobyrinate a,c-diamide synthase [Pseudobutyrivibrio sp.]